eukprot:2683544-Amphidinium_carterae.1
MAMPTFARSASGVTRLPLTRTEQTCRLMPVLALKRQIFPLFLEGFAGSGRLARHFKTQGFEVVAIDAGKSSKLVEAPVTYLDLVSPSHQSRVFDILHGPTVSFVHIRPPSATTTRGRERNLPGGGPSLPPLRCDAFPDGRPELSSLDAERVRVANSLFSFAAKLFQ